ncbi:MAG TPA: hypothetical protein VKK61_05825, partial [Tepidisphaeraceae bacterium]|nr:hypothetical protein [Tepidisphaeraceae bacterium]
MEQGYMFWGRGVLLSIFSTVLLPAAVSYGALQYTGVNLSGAEFGVSTGHTGTANLPGNYGSTYVYPDDPTQNISHTEVDYFIGKGMNTFRLPFRWERLQQSANAA